MTNHWGKVTAAFLLAANSHAATIISNLPGLDNSATSLFFVGNSKAMGFTIGESSWTLESATLRMNVGTPSTATFSLQLFSNNGSGNPGTALFTFTNPGVPDSDVRSYVFLPPSSFALQANTTYWLVLSNTGGSAFAWYGSFPDETPVGPGASHFGSKLSPITPPFQDSTFLSAYAVDGVQDVPEPASGVLAVSGVAALLLFRRVHSR